MFLVREIAATHHQVRDTQRSENNSKHTPLTRPRANKDATEESLDAATQRATKQHSEHSGVRSDRAHVVAIDTALALHPAIGWRSPAERPSPWPDSRDRIQLQASCHSATAIECQCQSSPRRRRCLPPDPRRRGGGQRSVSLRLFWRPPRCVHIEQPPLRASQQAPSAQVRMESTGKPGRRVPTHGASFRRRVLAGQNAVTTLRAVSAGRCPPPHFPPRTRTLLQIISPRSRSLERRASRACSCARNSCRSRSSRSQMVSRRPPPAAPACSRRAAILGKGVEPGRKHTLPPSSYRTRRARWEPIRRAARGLECGASGDGRSRACWAVLHVRAQCPAGDRGVDAQRNVLR